MPTLQSYAFSSNNGTSIAVNAPSGLTAGLLIVLYLDDNSSGVTWTPPDGTWTSVATTTATGAIFTHTATASEPATWTFTRSGLGAPNSAIALAVQSWGSVASAQLLGRTGRNGSMPFPAQAVSAAGSLLFECVTDFTGNDAWSPPAAMTLIGSDAAGGFFFGSQTVDPTATPVQSWTTPATNANCGGAGIVISPGINGQPSSTSQGKVTVTYNASNTFTVPAGVTAMRVQAEGAGGGSGAGAIGAGGGGGGGAYAEEPALAVTAGQTFTVTVPGTTPVTTAGGATAVVNPSGTTVVKAAGGSAGVTASGLGSGAGGAGGTTANSTGSIKTAGAAGTNGGAGGAGAAPLGAAGGATGAPGSAPGGGGGGGNALNGAAQTGGQGRVVISFSYATENMTTGDDVHLVVNWKRSFNESIPATDVIAKSILRPLSETLAATDDVSKFYLKKFQDENLLATDALIKAYRLARTEALTLADFALVVLVYLRSFNDAASATDALAKTMGLKKYDAAAALDEVFKLVIKKFPSESVSVSDSFVKFTDFLRSPADSVTSSDAYTRKFTVRFNDSISGQGAPAPSTGTRKIYVICD